ncbi:hypothetical protein M432DRAFT_435245 [Thermoascus aurantiacus ATCC 26904]
MNLARTCLAAPSSVHAKAPSRMEHGGWRRCCRGQVESRLSHRRRRMCHPPIRTHFPGVTPTGPRTAALAPATCVPAAAALHPNCHGPPGGCSSLHERLSSPSLGRQAPSRPIVTVAQKSPSLRPSPSRSLEPVSLLCPAVDLPFASFAESSHNVFVSTVKDTYLVSFREPCCHPDRHPMTMAFKPQG